MTRTLILDLDGTLIDSADDLGAALNRLMRSRDLAPFNRPEVVAMIGDGVEALVMRALAARKRGPDAAAVDAFRADYGQHAAEATKPYPGTAEVLQRLKQDGWRLGVCTNKPESAARTILKAVGLEHVLVSVMGGDGPRKPDPAHILNAVTAAGGTPNRSLAVGDHRNDIAAARGAGMKAIFALWGYGTPAMAEGATATAASILDIPGLAESLLR
jgi:phosphoglycolate phosphatase